MIVGSIISLFIGRHTGFPLQILPRFGAGLPGCGFSATIPAAVAPNILVQMLIHETLHLFYTIIHRHSACKRL